MATTWVEKYEVESLTTPGKTYTVARKENGSWGCGCPRWIFGRPRTDCKHILAMIAGMKPLTMAEWSMSMTGRRMRGFEQDTQLAVINRPVPVVNVITACIDNELFTVRRKMRV